MDGTAYMDHDSFRTSVSMVSKAFYSMIVSKTLALTLDLRPYLKVVKKTEQSPTNMHHLPNIIKRMKNIRRVRFIDSFEDDEIHSYSSYPERSIDLDFDLALFKKSSSSLESFIVPYRTRIASNGIDIISVSNISYHNISTISFGFDHFKSLTTLVIPSQWCSETDSSSIKLPPSLTHLDLDGRVVAHLLYQSLSSNGIKLMNFLRCMLKYEFPPKEVDSNVVAINVTDIIVTVDVTGSRPETVHYFFPIESLTIDYPEIHFLNTYSHITSLRLFCIPDYSRNSKMISTKCPKLKKVVYDNMWDESGLENLQINFAHEVEDVYMASYYWDNTIISSIVGENITSLDVGEITLNDLAGLPQKLRTLSVSSLEYNGMSSLPKTLTYLSMRLDRMDVSCIKPYDMSHLVNVETLRVNDVTIHASSTLPPNIVTFEGYNLTEKIIIPVLFDNMSVRFPKLKRLGIRLGSHLLTDEEMIIPKQIESLSLSRSNSVNFNILFRDRPTIREIFEKYQCPMTIFSDNASWGHPLTFVVHEINQTNIIRSKKRPASDQLNYKSYSLSSTGCKKVCDYELER